MPEFILEFGDSFERRSVAGTTIVFGRDEGCDVVLDDGSISRRHALIEKTESHWILKDLGSGNGIFLDGKKVRRVSLTRGDQFRLGDVVSVTFLLDVTETHDAEEPPQEEAATSPAPEGPEVADWDCVEFLGEGPLTQAFSYRKSGANTAACLRFLRTASSDNLAERLSVWNEVDHEGVARLELMATAAGEPVIRERLADSGSLSDFLKETGRVEVGVALKMSRMLAHALHALHDAGIRHGDLRTSRVRVMNEEGQVRISGPQQDEIRVRDVGDAFASSLSCTAPEFFGETPSTRPTRRGDIYALGAILHQLWVGVAVGEGRTVEGVERSVLRGLTKSPAERRRGLPDGLSDLISSCLASDENERPLTASDVVEALDGMQAKAAARGPSRPVQAAEKEIGQRQALPRKSVKHRTISWSITIILILLLNGLIMLAYKDKIGIFGSSESDSGMSGPLLSDLETEESQNPVWKEVEKLVSSDRYEDAAARIKAARASGELEADVAGLMATKLENRRNRRISKLIEMIEAEIRRGRVEIAESILGTLEGIVGSSDKDVSRLKAQIEDR